MYILLLFSFLITLLKEDKEKAIIEIFKRFQVDVMNYLKIKLSGNRELAEEIYQDAALSFINYVMKKNPVFSSESKIKNLLITIAINKLRDNYRKNKTLAKKTLIFKNEEEFSNCIDKISSNEKAPLESILENEANNKVNQSIKLTMSKLKDSHKEIMKLKFIENRSNPEIAAILGISVKAVESLIFRAKESFKSEFVE